jgi:hypothetical protein
MFGWLKKRKSAPAPGIEPTVKVYLNPLLMMLVAAEKNKGSPLTEQEVLAVRDSTVSIEMEASKAAIFYASLDAQVPVHRLDPDNLWAEWQSIREHVE